MAPFNTGLMAPSRFCQQLDGARPEFSCRVVTIIPHFHRLWVVSSSVDEFVGDLRDFHNVRPAWRLAPVALALVRMLSTGCSH